MLKCKLTPFNRYMLSDYEVRAVRDWDKNGGGLIEYVRTGVTCKILKHSETVMAESICSELTIAKNKWFCVGIYRPPSYNTLDTFFNEITISLT